MRQVPHVRTTVTLAAMRGGRRRRRGRCGQSGSYTDIVFLVELCVEKVPLAYGTWGN